MDNEELEGVKFSEFPSQTPVNADEVVGLHSGDNARFSIANIVAAVRNGLASVFVPLTRTINGKALSANISLDSSDIDYDNTGSGLTATDVQEAIDELAQGGGGGGSAADITYYPTTSGASATNVQDALDEAFDDLDDKQSTVTANGILKGDGAGGVSAATAGTDYQAPLTAGTDYATPAQLADKAAKADLTNIQATGTTNTTGAAIPAGAYFYLNGILYQAQEQIDQNATFTVNTNCKLVVDGALNEPNVRIAAYKYSGAAQQVQFTLNNFQSGYIYWFSVMLRTQSGFAHAYLQINTDNTVQYVQETSGASIQSASLSGGVLTINTSTWSSGVSIEQINIFSWSAVLNIVPV